MENMQLNPFDKTSNTEIDKEDRVKLFDKVKNGDTNALEQFISLEKEMIEKQILMHQHLNTHSKCSFTELYECAINEFKDCIKTMAFERYEKMITWNISAKIKNLLIIKNTTEATKQ